MTAKCHTPAPSGSRVPDEKLLDAVRECVLATGVRRSTLTQIARIAGVSRMTLYRRFPDLGSALAALMTREFGRLLDEIRAAAVTTDSARERLVRGAVAAVCALTADPLLRTVLDRDAEVILPYIVRRLGSTQRHAESFIAELIEQGISDGSVRDGPVRAQVRTVLLVTQSFTLSMRPAAAEVGEETLLSELEHMLHAALRPAEEKSHS